MRRATPYSMYVSLHGRISIHALHEESDPVDKPNQLLTQFQSTLSMRRATLLEDALDGGYTISIHALHEESDSARSGGVVL